MSIVRTFVVTAFAVERESEPRVAAVFGSDPLACRERRIVSHVSAMAAIENCAPMILVVQFIAGDYAMHFLLACRNRERTELKLIAVRKSRLRPLHQ